MCHHISCFKFHYVTYGDFLCGWAEVKYHFYWVNVKMILKCYQYFCLAFIIKLEHQLYLVKCPCTANTTAFIYFNIMFSKNASDFSQFVRSLTFPWTSIDMHYAAKSNIMTMENSVIVIGSHGLIILMTVEPDNTILIYSNLRPPILIYSKFPLSI